MLIWPRQPIIEVPHAGICAKDTTGAVLEVALQVSWLGLGGPSVLLLLEPLLESLLLETLLPDSRFESLEMISAEPTIAAAAASPDPPLGAQ